MAKTTITMTDDNNNIIDIELDICAESKWEAIDYFIPCGECGNIVFNATTKVVGDTHLCPVCARISEIDFEAIVTKAEDTFWATIASSFPTITTGDLDPSSTLSLSSLMKETVIKWYHTNIQAIEVAKPSIHQELNKLKLHFGQEWELEQTSDNTFIAHFLFYSRIDGNARRLGVSSTSVCVIDTPWERNSKVDYIWFYGDNPTAFFCHMEDHVINSDRFNIGKLFDDCQIISKSGLV